MALEDTEHLDKYQIRTPDPQAGRHRILVLGTGGGGSNAVSHMYQQRVDGIELMVLNTDMQALNMSPVPSKLLLGPKLCRGLGAGGKPEVGREAAEESIADIEALLEPRPDMVFVTAGMGGGTGTGASPVVARVAKSKGILTVGIVTIPFFFEGMPKIRSALRGAEELGKNVDALLVINNDRLTEIYADFAFQLAFAKANDILTVAARSISEIISTPIMVNLDMNDVDTTLRDGKTALISIGYGEGEGRMTKAIQNALHSPLLRDSDIYSSKRLLFAFYFSETIDPPFSAAESNEINNFIRDMNLEVDVIWGYGIDNTLDNQVKFTLLAAGFDVTVTDGNAKKPGAGEIHIIEGPEVAQDLADPEIDSQVLDNYGRDKVLEVKRRQETQNYFILGNDQLDDDEIIDMIERTPAYKRNKRAATVSAKQAAGQGAHPSDSDKGGQSSSKGGDIIFSMDDR